MNIKGLEFVRTCCACPEQYDVYLDGKQVGYVRLRWGMLYADYPECYGETIYWTKIGTDVTGMFESKTQRQEYLNLIADLILAKIKESNNRENENVDNNNRVGDPVPDNLLDFVRGGVTDSVKHLTK